MFREIFSKKKTVFDGREAYLVTASESYSLADTLECGQCFRHELIKSEDGYVEYIIPIGDSLANVGQVNKGELIFFPTKRPQSAESADNAKNADDTDNPQGAESAMDILAREIDEIYRPYFTLERDYEEICAYVKERTDSLWLKNAADAARGVAILKQDPWETLFSFIISQNNNIPRIRKIIKEICIAYGVNISLQNHATSCPIGRISTTPCEEKCRACGICYTFPRPEDILASPELMLPSRPGFRYKYLVDAAEKVARGTVNLDEIAAKGSYAYTVESLTRITGVGPKVAACAALFGFSNLEAFPIDVWMKRAIDTYFDGALDPGAFGAYAGIAQQYIFHYIRNLENSEK